jgi:hypothetical protein
LFLFIAGAILTWLLPGRLQLLGLTCAVVAIVLWLTAYRIHFARRALTKDGRKVLAVGWARVPDGCNFAIFPIGVDPATAEPDLVVRLPRIRPTVMTRALFYGSSTPSMFSGVALLHRDGSVLGAGRVRSHRSAKKVWARRNERTPRWMSGRNRNQPPAI